MAKKVERSIRLSQVVSNFGVGALYDILGESLVLTDTKKWLEPSHWGKGKEIVAARLLENLRSIPGYSNLRNFYEPAKDEKGSLPFMRFPRWLFCSKCRRMIQWKFEHEVTGESPTCSYCHSKPGLTPMRFITICEKGHMSDVDWGRWAHSGQKEEHQKTCQSKELMFIAGASKGGGLGSIAVKCTKCGSERSLEGITAPDILRTLGIKCSGKQPWQAGGSAAPCESRIHVVQRGAGNVYYPQIESALTIPPESQYRQTNTGELERKIMDHPLASFIGNGDNEMLFETIAEKIAKDVNCSKQEVIRIVSGNIEASETPGKPPDIGLEEWNALITENTEADDRDKFVTKHINFRKDSGPELEQCLGQLISVIKLREVRALTGFFRYHPGGTEEAGATAAIRPDLDGSLTWLPAVEVFGEGIFLTLNEQNLRHWEQLPEVRIRSAILTQRTGKSSLAHFLPTVTPRYILLHTLAHILIRRLAFECGYSSASLRERIYAEQPDEMQGGRAGILIYTTAGDSEGTLGGLARQAESKRFRQTLLDALQDAVNCSNDPICMESRGQGLDSLNLAACHACALVSETSCTSFNLMLDRATVIGDVVVPGFFQKLLNSTLESNITAS